MPSTYSPDLRIELIANGEQSGTWGTTTNINLGTLIEDAIAGLASVSVTTANQALTALNGAADQARCAAVSLSTTTLANFAVYVPPVPKLYVIRNTSAYVATIYCSTVLGNTTAAGTGIAIPASKTVLLRSDGTNIVEQLNHVVGNFSVGGNVSITGTTTLLDDLILNSSSGTSGQVVVSQGAGNPPAWGNAFVAGMIMMWSGSIATIPSGWQLCDGTSGTPDLRNRFVLGAGSGYPVGDTGGSKDATLVNHTHTASSSVNDPGHSHSTALYYRPHSASGAAQQYAQNTTGFGGQIFTNGNTTGITVSTSITATGSSAVNANMPPYYALAFIMKL